MKTGIILLFLIFHSVTLGQSPKKLNKQLRAQSLLEQQKQDSAFVLFTRTSREFDSIKRIANERMDLLSNEEKRALKSVDKTVELSKQLKELGIDPYTIIPTENPNKDQLPKYREFTRPLKEILRADVKFEKVSNRLYLDMMKRKEQNIQLAQKVKEYRDHAKINSISQENLESNKQKLFAFFPKLDSLSAYYNAVTKEFNVKETKLQNKLYELRAEYIKKGPKGFSEAYRKVFYDAFPPPQVEKVYDVDRRTIEGADGPFDIPVEPAPVDAKYENSSIHTIVDEPASFPGGSEALKTFVSKNLRFPESMKEASIQGKVYLKFIVSEKGEISDVTIMRGIPDCKECDREAIRMVKSMPKWIPGKNNGKAVKSFYNLPVRFTIE